MWSDECCVMLEEVRENVPEANQDWSTVMRSVVIGWWRWLLRKVKRAFKQAMREAEELSGTARTTRKDEYSSVRKAVPLWPRWSGTERWA